MGTVQGQVPNHILDMSLAALNHGVAPEALVALLNGNVSESGMDITPFKDLGGALSRLGGEESRTGGPLTEAIKVRVFDKWLSNPCEPVWQLPDPIFLAGLGGC